MKPSEVAYVLIREWEQLYLRAYPDPASPLAKSLQSLGLWQKTLREGVAAIPGDILASLDGKPWTIGYGDTGPHVTPNSVITPDEANRRMIARVAREYSPAIDKALQREVQQCQYDALIDLAYNCGANAIANSTLMRVLNAGDVIGAALEFDRWNKAGGSVLAGLVRRRYCDALVFLGTDVNEAIREGRGKKL